VHTPAWFIFQESIKKSANPFDSLIKAVADNSETLENYREIQLRYEKLINLQYF
jgi:hypothetical protein